MIVCLLQKIIEFANKKCKMSLPADLSFHLLTNYFTYRDQYNLMCVCHDWRKLLLTCPANYTYSYRLLASIFDDWNLGKYSHERVRAAIDVTSLLILPDYRIFFMDRGFCRIAIKKCVEFINHFNSQLRQLTKQLCILIDSELISNEHYWLLIHRRGKHISADITYQQYADLFDY